MKLRNSGPKVSMLSSSFRTYSVVYLFTEEFVQIFSLCYGACHCVIVVTAILCVYGAVKLPGLLAAGSFCFAFNCITVTIGMISIWSGINLSSTKLLAALNSRIGELQCIIANDPTWGAIARRKMTRWLKRKVTALQKIRLRMGHFCVYTKFLIIGTLLLISKGSIRLLIM